MYQVQLQMFSIEILSKIMWNWWLCQFASTNILIKQFISCHKYILHVDNYNYGIMTERKRNIRIAKVITHWILYTHNKRGNIDHVLKKYQTDIGGI